MTIARALWSVLVTAMTPLALLRLAWRARRQPAYLQHVGERFGRYAIDARGPLIWIHAVSVGETRAAQPLVNALRLAHPDHRILLTHMTPTGRETSVQLFGDSVLRCYLPYDTPGAVDRFLRYFQPVLGMMIETELWPNLIGHAAAAGTPLLLVNARLSERSARGYARVRRLTAEALGALRIVAAQTQADAQRLSALGARDVQVTGNLKFDRGPTEAETRTGLAMRALWGGRFVFLAASTREGEEALILDALAAQVDTMLVVLVPRHPQRFDEVAQMLGRRGLRYQRRSDNRPLAPDTRVVLGDSMGEMFAYFTACDAAFIGGSLLPLGGQNLLEACAVGRAVLIGPHTFNFTEATELAIAAGAALRVENAETLSSAVARLREHVSERERMGEAGLHLMRQHQGATARTLALIEPLLKQRGRGTATR